MANSYGMGHPTMDCGELKRTARATGLRHAVRAACVAAADVLLAGRPGDDLFLLAQR